MNISISIRDIENGVITQVSKYDPNGEDMAVYVPPKEFFFRSIEEALNSVIEEVRA